MAYYYPIKCPYCLKTHTNATVRFNLNDSAVEAKRPAKRIPDREDELYIENADNDSDSDWTADRDNRSNRSKKFPTEGFFTFAELQEIFGYENVAPKTKPVLALPALTSEAYHGELLTGVTYTVTEDGWDTTRIMKIRYCDCEDSRKISQNSGSIPSYVILLMGSSDSGKTVYLASLYNALEQRSEYLLPPVPYKAIASLSLDVLSEGKEETDIATIAEDLFEEGILPITTINLANEPLEMIVTIKFRRSGLINKALLFLRDAPGEIFTNRDKRRELHKIANQFPGFDGFIITFDPMTFDETVFPVEDIEKDKSNRKQVSRFKQVLIREIAPTMVNNMISQPAVAIITKGDMLFKRDVIGSLKNKGLSYAMPLLTMKQDRSFDRPYFNEVDAGARNILERLSRNISEMMGAHFSNVFFSLVSALSRDPIDIHLGDDGRKHVSASNAISPWHVTDPMLFLLMRLNIVPPLDKTYARLIAGETKGELDARIYRNRNVINEWGAKYCSGGSNEKLV